MRCIELEALVSDYADGIANQRERRIVERHLLLCNPCREAVLLARQIGLRLTRLSLLPIGVLDRVPRLRTRLERRLEWPQQIALLRPVKTFLTLLVGIVGILLLIIAFRVGL